MRCPNIPYSYISPTNLAAAVCRKKGTIVEIRGDPSDSAAYANPCRSFSPPASWGPKSFYCLRCVWWFCASPKIRSFVRCRAAEDQHFSWAASRLSLFFFFFFFSKWGEMKAPCRRIHSDKCQHLPFHPWSRGRPSDQEDREDPESQRQR